MIQHVAIEVREADVPACARFWALLGFERVEPPPALASRAAWVQSGETQVHLLFAEEAVVPPSGHIAVVVDDYDAALEALRDAGFEPDPRTEYWGSPRCFVRCPAGHRVEVMAFGPSGGLPAAAAGSNSIDRG
jgi:catechol 2,3-dioxygenase-like lactoylglutathione lyase family enzyme